MGTRPDLRRRSLRNVARGLAAAIFLLAPTSGAEGFFDLYAGAAWAENDELNCNGCAALGLGALTRLRLDYDEPQGSFGIRGGYWLPGAANFVGLALDLSTYRATDEGIADIDIIAVPLTPLLMFRVPLLTSDAFPNGQLQPYGAIGPGVTLTVARADLSNFNVGFDDFADAKIDVGLDARGGLAIQLTDWLALFAEYRHTRIDLDYDANVDFDFGPDLSVDADTHLNAHHLAGGVSFRF